MVNIIFTVGLCINMRCVTLSKTANTSSTLSNFFLNLSVCTLWQFATTLLFSNSYTNAEPKVIKTQSAVFKN